MGKRVAALGALAALAVAGVPAGRGATGLPRAGILSWDAHHRIVRLTLLAGLGNENNGFNFDGYGRGELVVTVPLGAHVVVDCENRGGRSASCAIISNSLSTVPAFRHAASPNPWLGLDPGAKATFAFRASRIGSFRIASLVPGEEQARMFDVFDVRRVARPSVSIRPGP